MVEDGSEPSAAQTDADSRRIDKEEAMASLTGNFYRGEVERTASWRGRLDQTTNWAVVVVGAILTWAFSSGDNPHYVILIGVFGVSAFLVMEATRYREYDVWRNRVRILQTDLYAEMYAPSPDAADWQTRLAQDLRNPEFHLTMREALTHRLRRSYLALLLILLAAWVARVTVFQPSQPWTETASILGVSGVIVATAVGLFYAVVVLVAAVSVRGETVMEFQE
ncbi:DUF2270 domain-containing protein [Halosimplex aquaticum]|uniref:DUF2270 domain-containing protein n=1 Tax=Halosimplex aquaticum TaxID=3026162 RepID=A0ABD5Y099_9EURY|nr:DUF2270 domain-containing protein [Halosimplex aquaticum]